MTIPFLSPETPFALLLVLALLPFALRQLGTLRRSLINTGIFFVVCLAGDLLAGLLAGWIPAQASRWLAQMAVFGIGLAVIRLLGLVFFNIALPRMHIHVSGILADILVIVAYVAWGFLRLSLAGVELSHLVATSAIITAVLAFAMQDTLGNLLGGLSLQMDNSLEIGDWIKIDDISGQVIEIQWRYTALRTRANEKVVVPNSQLMKGRYTVLCDKTQEQPTWRRCIDFNIDFAIPPGRVITLVENDLAAASIPNLSPSPAPQCLLHGFGPGYAQYQLRYWLFDPLPDEPTDAEVRVHILATLQRNGIRLATDDHIIHLVEEGAQHRAEVARREVERRLNAIDSIEIFAHLTAEEKQTLANRLVNAPFARGDTLVRQGSVAQWLYIIISGEAEAWWQPPDGSPRRLLEKRGPGSVFGEIGLITGAPRRATVIATQPIEAYRLNKAAFEEILRRRPELADTVSEILERRLKDLAELERGYWQGKHDAQATPGKAALGRRIREFFGL